MRFFIRLLFVAMRLDNERLERQTYTVTHLRRTLIDILEHGQNVCVRFRAMGEMWQTNFVRVVSVTEQRVLVNDETRNQLISVELSRIVQFEIDHRFKGLEPHNHYEVSLDTNQF